MPAAVTLQAASLVPVNQDTLEMDLPAQVNNIFLHVRMSKTSQMTGFAYLCTMNLKNCATYLFITIA